MAGITATTDASWVGATLTFVAAQGAVQVATAAATMYTTGVFASGVRRWAANIDLSGGNAGDCDLALIDSAGNLAWSETVQINAAGDILDTRLTAAEVRTEIDSNSTQLAAIVADTNELQVDDVPGLIAALNDLDAAGIRTAVGLAAANLDTQFGSIGAVLVDADPIIPGRTWFADDYRARNIVEVANGFLGTLAMAPALNLGTTIASVSSVTVVGPASVTTSSLAVDKSRTRAHFDVPALTTAGTYTATVTVTTIDSQTIVTTGTLRVV